MQKKKIPFKFMFLEAIMICQIPCFYNTASSVFAAINHFDGAKHEMLI